MDKFMIKNHEFLRCLMYTNPKAEIDIYRCIKNLLYGKFSQEIVEKNRVDLLRTPPEEFIDNIRKIMEKDNKTHCNSSNHKKSKYKIYPGELHKK